MPGERFRRARGGERRPAGPALWFVFAGRHLLLRPSPPAPPAPPVGDGLAVPLAAAPEELDLPLLEPIYMGTLDGIPCVAAALSGATAPAPTGYEARDLRALYGLVPEVTWAVAALAFQLTEWAANTRYCPRTGEPTHLRPGEWAMECSSCDLLQYPTVTPCIIVLVHDGDRVLMTRQATWPAGRYGLVAGYVEAGETLEQCVTREVREETGIAIDHLRYFSSQAWPFPHQLMAGFTARYAGGGLVVDTTELEHAAWFSLDVLPILPPPPSIARRIIDAHLAAYEGRRGSAAAES